MTWGWLTPARERWVYFVLLAVVAVFGLYLGVLLRDEPHLIILSTDPAGGELATARAQLELLQQHSNRLVEMVGWSLGATVTMALGLAAFSWFTNKNLYERDQAQMRSEFTALIATEQRRIHAAIFEQFAAARAESKAQATQIEAAATKAATEAATGTLAKVQAEARHTAAQLTELRFSYLEDKAKVDEKAGHTWHALRLHAERIGLALRMAGSDYYVDGVLDDIRDLLKDESIPVDAMDARMVIEALGTVSIGHKAIAEDLITAIRRHSAPKGPGN